MSFTSAISRATDRVYAVAGVAARYQDRDGFVTDCTVLLERDLSRYGEVAQVQARTAVLSVRVSELAEAPRKGELFTVGDVELRVDALLRTDEIEHKVVVA